MMQNSTYYFHYDFACKKVPLSLGYAKKICMYLILLMKLFLSELNYRKLQKNI
jgi:hypothetical protein